MLWRRTVRDSRSVLLRSGGPGRRARTTPPSHCTPVATTKPAGSTGRRTTRRGATIIASGAVAQLGERRNGIAKVRGSIPLGSTRSTSRATLASWRAAPALLIGSPALETFADDAARPQRSTVLGPVEPASLGVVMPHEHLFVDLTCMFDPPTEASDRSRAYAPFSLEHLGWIRTHYFRHRPNLDLDDEEVAASEVGLYKAAGGSHDRRRLHTGNRPRPARARAAVADDGSARRHGDRLLRRLDASAGGRGDERDGRRPAA